MPVTEMIVSAVVANGIVLIVAMILRTFNIRSFHKTVTVAIEQGSPDASALIDRLGRSPRIRYRLIAYILLALAAAIVGVGALEGNFGDLKEAAGAALFPGFVGVAILLYLRGAERAGDA